MSELRRSRATAPYPQSLDPLAAADRQPKPPWLPVILTLTVQGDRGLSNGRRGRRISACDARSESPSRWGEAGGAQVAGGIVTAPECEAGISAATATAASSAERRSCARAAVRPAGRLAPFSPPPRPPALCHPTMEISPRRAKGWQWREHPHASAGSRLGQGDHPHGGRGRRGKVDRRGRAPPPAPPLTALVLLRLIPAAPGPGEGCRGRPRVVAGGNRGGVEGGAWRPKRHVPSVPLQQPRWARMSQPLLFFFFNR